MNQEGYNYHGHSDTQRLEETPEMNTERDVKNEWYKAWLEGNALLPQTELGYYASFLNTLTADPNLNWQVLLASRLSPDQIADIGKRMSNMHAARNIRATTETHRSLFAKEQNGDSTAIIPQLKIVGEERLQEVWNEVAYGAAQIIEATAIQQGVPFPKRDAGAYTEKTMEAMNVFWHTPEHTYLREQIQRIVHSIYETLLSSRGKALARDYKNEFQTDPRPDSKDIWDRYKEKFRELVREGFAINLTEQDRELSEFLLEKMMTWVTEKPLNPN